MGMERYALGVRLFQDYLLAETGHDQWNVTVEPSAALSQRMSRGGQVENARGGVSPFTGRQRFEMAIRGGGAVVVNARVERVEMLVFAVRDVARGDLIRASDCELRPHAGEVPARAMLNVRDVIGKEAVQAIRGSSPLLANVVRSPIIVRKGERVEIRAKAAGITVRTFGIASQDGSLGDLITVDEQAANGKALKKDRLTARVTGTRELEVFAAGTSAGDFATTRR